VVEDAVLGETLADGNLRDDVEEALGQIGE
jgi:hypothetical protein